MNQLRKRLTYANVMSSIAVFLVLGGATAFAASQLGKNSVGTKQLKANAVTKKKLKKNSVVRAKIANSAVNGAKVRDASLTSADLDAATNDSFSHVVARIRGTAGIPWTTGAVYPLNSPTYTQAAGRDDQFIGTAEATFSASCTQPRSVSAYLLIDAVDPTRPKGDELAGLGVATDSGAGTVTKRIEFVPLAGGVGMSKFAPGADTPHTFSILLLTPTCTAGSGITASAAGVDVIGTK